MVFLWLFYGFLWFFYGFSMFFYGFLWFSMVFYGMVRLFSRFFFLQRNLYRKLHIGLNVFGALRALLWSEPLHCAVLRGKWHFNSD